MKAVRVNQWGQPVQLEDIPQPSPASDEVLVRVHAASINPLDTLVHAGYMQGMVSIPLTLGTDFSGEVMSVGSEINHLKTGDAIYGLVPMHSGSFAEYLVAKSGEVALKPQTLNHIQAAGVPLACLAGYQSLFDLGQVQKGQSVLIIGSAGAVGGTALQLAKSLGTTVYAVDIPEKANFVRALGPDRFIDSTTERYEDIVGTVDLVLDFVGGDNLQRSLTVLRSGGRYVTSLFLPPQPPEDAVQRGITLSALATQPRTDQLNDLAARIDAGTLKIFINSTFPLGDVNAAMAFRMTTTNPGKVVLTVL